MEYTYRSMLCCSYACTLFSWLLDVSGSRDFNVPPFVLEKRSLMSEVTSAKGVGRIWMEMEGVSWYGSIGRLCFLCNYESIKRVNGT